MLAGGLVYSDWAHFRVTSHLHFNLPQLCAVSTGLFLLVGLWTPLAGALLAIIELWMVISGVGDPFLAIGLGSLGASLAMIGPGAWSIDARLFGRRHIETHDRSEDHWLPRKR
jgi:putative oxidoreductase